MAREVVITGIGMISPVGNTIDDSWSNLINGNSGIDTIQSFDPSDLETKIAGEIKNFNPIELIGKKEARRMDRFSQLALVAGKEALNSAQLIIDETNENRVSVMITSGIGGIITLSEQINVMRDKGASRISPFLVPMMLPDMASGQVSMILGAQGPNFSTVSACSSGGDALGQAWEIIANSRADIALTGGTEAAICPIGVAGFNSCKALSKRNDDPQRASRPFDSERDGFVLGEGAAVLVLESEQNVSERGVTPLAEIVGYGSTADAHHITQPSPGGAGGARAMKIALDTAGIKPNEIDYINAHGTSTPLNDRQETQAIKRALGEDAYRIPISSTKSMTGHLLGAGGALEATLCVKALEHNVIPPTINLDRPDDDCDLDYTPNTAREESIKVVMSNSFGFGGHNAVLVMRKVPNGS